MIDLNGNQIKQEEIKLESVQDVIDCGKAIKENMDFAIGMAKEGAKGFHNVYQRLFIVHQLSTDTPKSFNPGTIL